MKILQAYKFQLQLKVEQSQQMKQFAGCCRFVWNHGLATEKDNYEQGGKYLGYNSLAKQLTGWKREVKTAFLATVHSQILQQSLRHLDRAYKEFMSGKRGFPKLKKRGQQDSFTYPQGFKVDEPNSRIYLPKIGWVRYRKSRDIQGLPKNVTISLSCDKWYVSIQTEQEVAEPIHSSLSSVGIDMGIANFATLSDGTQIASPNALTKHLKKLSKLQRQMAKKVKGSGHWLKAKKRVSKLHSKIKNIRNDFLHKTSTMICKTHATIVLEELKIKNNVAVDACTPLCGYRHGPSAHPLGRLSRSAAGTIENPGKNVRAKSGLNRLILDQGWGEFKRQLQYKATWNGGKVVFVPPQYTSQQCSQCGHTEKENRKTQAKFKCLACGYKTHADYNAALNILAAGHAVIAHGVGKAQAPTRKCEPTYGVA